MRLLPAETLHCPFGPGPYRMAMDLVTVPETDWFEIDERYPPEMAEKRSLLADRRADVFAATQGSEAARAEALAMIIAALAEHHPDWFAREGERFRNHLTGETWSLNPPDADPLEVAGRLVREDFCLIQDSPDGPVLAAAVLCFPSRWRLADKIGRPLAAVHEVVP